MPGLAGCRALYVVLVLLLPGEQAAQFAADALDGVLLSLGTQRLELGAAVVLVVDEALGERAALDVGEDSLHVFLHLGGDDARAGDVVAVFCGVGNAPALLGDAAFPHEVNDELELVKDLEVSDLRLVAGLGQGLEAVLDQLGYAAAQ